MERYENAIKFMEERFAKDSLISLVTVDGTRIVVRMVNSYYEDGAFYVVTNAISGKMQQIKANPEVVVCAFDWFSGRGKGENLGWVRDESNAAIMAKLREAFASWYTHGDVNEDDKNTCLLRIRLTDGNLFDNEKRYEEWIYNVDFVNRTA